MIHFTIKQLRYFEALVEHGHFGNAARVCSISQPALSMQIKELEESLGIALFERQSRKIRLTSFGEEFAKRVSGILRSVDDLADIARASREKLVGRLRIGIIPTIAPYLLPSLVGSLSREFKGLDLQVRETKTSNLIQSLLDGQLDVAIAALPTSEPSLKEVDLIKEKFVLVRPRSDADQPVPDQKMLMEMRLLLLEEGHCFRDQALSFCSVQSTKPREILEGSSLSTLVQMVGSGLGVTLIPEMAVPVETRSAPVSIARFAAPEPTRTVGMIWRKSNPLEKQFLQVSQVVRESTEVFRGLNLEPKTN